MFAVGIISDDKFDTESIDIKVYYNSIENTKEYISFDTHKITMEHCNISHWEGISD
jgi:hypothetical protein